MLWENCAIISILFANAFLRSLFSIKRQRLEIFESLALKQATHRYALRLLKCQISFGNRGLRSGTSFYLIKRITSAQKINRDIERLKCWFFATARICVSHVHKKRPQSFSGGTTSNTLNSRSHVFAIAQLPLVQDFVYSNGAGEEVLRNEKQFLNVPHLGRPKSRVLNTPKNVVLNINKRGN